MLPDMGGDEELWIPLVDEPIGSIVAQIQEENPEIGRLVDSPRKLLAFRTFAYVRVGLLLGGLLVESDVETDETGTWADQLMRSPEHHDQVVAEVRAVAEEIAADPAYEGESVGPSDVERERFATFAKQRLSADS
jgi:hypothetical protein